MPEQYHFRLYIVGETVGSKEMIDGIKSYLDERLPDFYRLEVIDILKEPRLAEQDNILATPLIMRVLPSPVKKMIGNLNDREKVLTGLGVG